MIKLKVYNESGDSILSVIEFETVEQLKEYKNLEVSARLLNDIKQLKKWLNGVRTRIKGRELISPSEQETLAVIKFANCDIKRVA